VKHYDDGRIAPLSPGQIPGSVERLNSLPIGSILADSSNLSNPAHMIHLNWRRTSPDEWTLYIGNEPANQGEYSKITVTPDDRFNLSNLARWIVYRVGHAQFIIEEEPV
jgi:hypothetical protein